VLAGSVESYSGLLGLAFPQNVQSLLKRSRIGFFQEIQELLPKDIVGRLPTVAGFFQIGTRLEAETPRCLSTC
jgi:hypothetical protein